MNTVRIISLGGSPQVTRNMFVYEHRSNGKIVDILLVDCGIGFPDESMFGVDYLIPDISYLKDKKQYIRGLILTHGHMDHIGALKYILPQIQVKTYGTRLTCALAEADLREVGLKTEIQVIDTNRPLNFGKFSVSFVRVTHSIPDAVNLVIKSPVGAFYHGSDYKFDWTPVDGQQTEVDKIVKAAGDNGVLCLLSDCVRSERDGYTLSEKIIEKSLQAEIQNCEGKFIFSTFSSNISRIQQAVNVALENDRLICFSGRSIRKSVQVAKLLKYLQFPKKAVIREPQLGKYQSKEVVLILTGSQGEPGSALSKIANEEHRFISVTNGDKIILSSDPIPGNERSVDRMINRLSALGAKVVYSDIHDSLHVSGHGARNDLALMLALTRPKHIIPMGGEYKQMVQYKDLAVKMGYKENNIFLLGRGDIISFEDNGNVKFDKPIDLKNIMVDGLGIGDVGNIILRDRSKLAEHGFVVAIVPYDINKGQVVGSIEIVSRGFVFHKKKGSERLIQEAKDRVYMQIKTKKGKALDWKYLRKKINDDLESFFYEKLNRRPLILPVIVEV
jgi:ribonuclease J